MIYLNGYLLMVENVFITDVNLSAILLCWHNELRYGQLNLMKALVYDLENCLKQEKFYVFHTKIT